MPRSISVASLLLTLALLAGCTTQDSELLELGSGGTPPSTVAPTLAPEPTTAPTVTAAPVEPQSTSTPESAAATPAIAAAPVVIKGGGQKTSYSGEANCTAPALDLTLTVNPNGVAQLAVIGPGFVDHYNCTQAASPEAWYLEGTADLAGETVTFTTCNMGNFAAQGTVAYAGGALNGEAICLYSKGSAAGTRAIAVTMP